MATNDEGVGVAPLAAAQATVALPAHTDSHVPATALKCPATASQPALGLPLSGLARTNRRWMCIDRRAAQRAVTADQQAEDTVGDVSFGLMPSGTGPGMTSSRMGSVPQPTSASGLADIGHYVGNGSSGGVILSGTDVRLVSPTALSRWREILLVEDDSARAVRLGAAGVADRASRVLLRVHRIGHSGIRLVDERCYEPGPRGAVTRQRSDLALDVLDGQSCRGSVIVCGPAYGCSPRFMDGLAARGLDAVVEVRASSLVALDGRGNGSIRVPASDLLGRAKWHSFVVPVAGVSDRSVTYAVSRLGGGRVGSGPTGSLFVAQTGGINGVHRGTVFGFCLRDDVALAELIETVGWARWIRPLIRRDERFAERQEATPAEGPAVMNGAQPKLRANIKLSRGHDQVNAAARLISHEAPTLRGVLASESRPVNVVELFAGAGGMGLGFLLACPERYRLVYAGEVDPICVQTLRSSHAALDQTLMGDSRWTPALVEPVDLRSKEALEGAERAAGTRGGADVLIGGPPCQGFSNANRNSWHSSNPHNHLIDVFLDYVVRLTPRVFLLENVQGIHWTRSSGAPEARSSVLDHIKTRMAAAGYEVFVQLLDAVWYGVPQYRSRFFVLGIHRDLGYNADDFGSWGPFPKPSHGPGASQPYITVRDAIGDLPAVGNGHAVDRMSYVEPTTVAQRATNYLTFLRAGAERGALTDHVTSRHADYVIERYRNIPPGGNWQSIAASLTNYTDVNRTHSNIYRRLLWDEPSITIGHYRKSMLVHPLQHRGLSLREAARLQSFPDWFRFAGSPIGDPGGLVHKQQQLANAVCPLVTRAIAEFILGL
jgi:DNA-cytosine methyltransferase